MSNRVPGDADRHIGLRVREARKFAGLSQEALGDKLGVTFQQVQKYERGSNRISAGTLVLVADALDRPVAWFFEGMAERAAMSDEDKEATAWTSTRRGAETMRVMSRLDLLEPVLAQSVLHHARVLMEHAEGEIEEQEDARARAA